MSYQSNAGRGMSKRERIREVEQKRTEEEKQRREIAQAKLDAVSEMQATVAQPIEIK